MKDRSRTEGLLTEADPHPVLFVNRGGASPFLLVGDHAGRNVPSALGSLGLAEEELSRHIGWDIGVGELGALLASELDAVFIGQRYSRLVVDCNRRPNSIGIIPAVSDGTRIPGNDHLGAEDKNRRVSAIHEPYQRAIANELGRRRCQGSRTTLVSLHSFTPSLREKGSERPWHVGVLYNRGETAFARRLLRLLSKSGALCVGDNEPYRMAGGCTVPRHAYPGGIPYALLEVRQDLLSSPSGLENWTRKLAKALRQTLRDCA